MFMLKKVAYLKIYSYGIFKLPKHLFSSWFSYIVMYNLLLLSA